jgi:hypothetical protein
MALIGGAMNALGLGTPTNTTITQSATPTSAPTVAQSPTATLTPKPTQTPVKPTATSSSTSAASHFIKLVLIAPVYGKVTNATITQAGQRKVDVGIDVTITNPTQARVKHVAYEILSTLQQVKTVDGANVYFHANGYTGKDDPIASDSAISGEFNWASLDDNSAWNDTAGVFHANLP